MALKNLKQKAAAGMVWTALQKYSTLFITFISGIILARLLTPYDYGCIGMLSIFMVIAESLIDGGFGSALIQKKKPTQVDYSTIFFWNLGVSLFLYCILYLSAPAIAKFYKIPELSAVLRVQGVILLIYAFNIIQRNQLKKKLDFKILAIISITTSLTALAVTIIMAYHGYGVWSLVAQNILVAAIPSLFFWFYVKWRPIWTFSWRSFKELFGFGFYMFLTHLVNRFSKEIQGLLIGRVFSPAIMGYYSKARGTTTISVHAIEGVITQVTYPLYAEVQDDKKLLGNVIKRLSMTVTYFTHPLLLLLVLLAKPIFLLLYSERWLPSVPYFQVLCLAGLATCLQSVNLQSISAIGKSRTMFLWTLIKRGVYTILTVSGLYLFGMYGLVTGVVIGAWFAFFVNIGLVSKHIGYKWTQQFIDILPVFVVSSISALVSYIIASAFSFGIYMDGLVKFTIFCVIYLGWSFTFKPKAYEYFKSILPLLFAKIKKKS